MSLWTCSKLTYMEQTQPGRETRLRNLDIEAEILEQWQTTRFPSEEYQPGPRSSASAGGTLSVRRRFKRLALFLRGEDVKRAYFLKFSTRSSNDLKGFGETRSPLA